MERVPEPPVGGSLSSPGDGQRLSTAALVSAAPSASLTVPPQPDAVPLLSVCVGGRCSRRLSWSEVALLVREGRFESLGRLDQQLAEYAASKAAILAEYHTITDRLREQRLGAPCRLEDGRKRCDWSARPGAVQSELAQQTANGTSHWELLKADDGRPMRVCWYPKYARAAPTAAPAHSAAPRSSAHPRVHCLLCCVRCSEFLYAVADDVQHHLLWSDAFLAVDSRLCCALLERHRPLALYERASFINPPYLRSVPDLHHIHVFSRRRAQPQSQAAHAQSAEPVHPT